MSSHQCGSQKVNPSTGDLLQCVLIQGHVGPHQATDQGPQGVTRTFQWSS